jgi:hypothetical protein
VIAALATACGERKESSEGAARPPDSPPPRTQPALPTAPPAAPAFDAAPLPPLPPPLPAQLPAHAAAMQFLGWTGDGRMYAIRATHGYDEEELGGPNQVALFQVHDTATGALVRSFQIQRLAGDEVRDDDLLSRAWAQSQPKPAWQQFRADTPLVARDPALASPDATWTIAGEPADKPPRNSSLAIAAPDGAGAIETRWTGFAADDMMRPSRRPLGSPGVRIVARRGGQSVELLTVRPPYDYEAINASRTDAGNPEVTGAIRAYWSPAGDRVLIAAEHQVSGVRDEHGDMADVRWSVYGLPE